MLLCGCGNCRAAWHDERLAPGRVVKVTSFNLAWGAEHDDRDSHQDCFAMEYVSNQPRADPRARELATREVFELIRPASELWGFTTATLAGFPTTERKGHYDLFAFRRGPDGTWSCRRYPSKVFVND